MARTDDLYGRKDPAALFGRKSIAGAPFPPALHRNEIDYSRVESAVGSGQEPEPVDPRTLRSMQPHVTRAGVSHYMQSDEVYKDKDQAGNRTPVVYEHRDQRAILSGHHRATKALLQGEQFHAVVVKGESHG
jgi:hypothetical protein